MIYNLTGFSKVRIFSIVFGNDIIMMSFLVTWFSNLDILWNVPKAISLQSFNAVDCGSSFTEGLQKHNDDAISYFGIRNSINLPSFKSLSYLNQILQWLV